MAMLSLTPPKPTTPLFPSPFHGHPLSLRRRLLPSPFSSPHLKPISASKLPTPPPPTPPGAEVYQPFRPPPSPLPAKYRSLNPAERLDILRDRLGLWHEYAPLIASLSQDGFTPPSIEEVTGITGIEQNRLIVAAQVRDSLLSSSSFPPDILSFFDAAGTADLLYELRLLNAAQRAAAARHVVDHNLDSKSAQELARAIKDFPRRRGDNGWDQFSAASPGDCLAYTHFRLSREAIDADDKLAALEKAIEAAETEKAKKRIEEEMKKGSGGEGGEEEGEVVRVTVPVVRLRYGEVAEATSVVLLPVIRAVEGEKGLGEAPERCRVEGEMGVVAAEKGWGRWVVLPGWGPAKEVGEEGGVAVEFEDGRVIPWRVKRWEKEEKVVVVVDRKRRKVEEENDGFYLVGGEGLGVERGGKLLEKGVREALGMVVLVVRPPKEEEEDQLGDEDWV